MPGWLDEVEEMVLSGRIKVPYKWWVGETGSRFPHRPSGRKTDSRLVLQGLRHGLRAAEKNLRTMLQ